MPFDLVIHTRRLLLRPLQPADVDALYALHRDPLFMRYWSTPPWTSDEPARQMVAVDQAAGAGADWLRLGLVRRDDDALVGSCDLFDHDRQSRRAMIGYGLAPAQWGQGLMHEALLALLNHGFTDWGLNRVEADIDPRNLGSARVLERLGFRREGLLRQRWIVGDEVSDSAWYGLLRSEWRGAGLADAADPPSTGDDA
ncbi:MAG: GNAT family N-acetyltransferase [Rubrivivax sp.]|nr:GNAT family N-acetyltransferase [Rubrivivax sp.]